MIRFNLIGTGFLDFEADGGIGFKAENPYFRFADVSLGRSTEFSVPATDRNRQMLGFGEDAAMSGEMLRANHAAQMVYDGGQKLGTLAITAYEGNSFKCVFYLGGADWIDRLQDLQLADCPTSFTKGVFWSTQNAPIAASAADPSAECQILQYDNAMSLQTPAWQLVPSVNVKTFIEDVLTELGVPHDIKVDDKYWMVAGSMHGGDEDSVTFNVTGTNAATVNQSQAYFTVEQFDLEWARTNLFGALVGGGSTNAVGFKTTEDVSIAFPATVPTPLFLIKWNKKLRRCEVVGGAAAAGIVYGIEPLAGRTIDIPKGNIIFFAESPMLGIDANGTYIGWKDIAHPLTLTCLVSRSSDLAIDEIWHLGVNMPNCTIFEFLKSVAVATGLELTIDPTNGITMDAGSYGVNFKTLDDVISVDSVTRCVNCWGNGNNKAKIVFDSEDYVTDHIVAEFDIDTELVDGEQETKVIFSEGAVGSNGIRIEDVSIESNTYKFVAKKWTLAYAAAGETLLQRVAIPNPIGYDDIADNSTCIRVKVAAGEADFFGLSPSTTFTWRGSAYVWTDADWTDGVLSLTLQRVSQQ